MQEGLHTCIIEATKNEGRCHTAERKGVSCAKVHRNQESLGGLKEGVVSVLD